jgi:hypothetical protein
MEKHDVPTGIKDWPQENGHPVPPDKLSTDQVQSLLKQANNESGLTDTVTGRRS